MSLRPVWDGLGTERIWEHVLAGQRPEVRPEDVAAAPARYVELMREQWATDPEERPSFVETFKRMNRLCRRAGADTPPRASAVQRRNVRQDLSMAAAFLQQARKPEPLGKLFDDDGDDGASEGQRTLYVGKRRKGMKTSTLESVLSAATAAAPGLFVDTDDLEGALVAASSSAAQRQQQQQRRDRGDSLLSTGSTISRLTMRGASGDEEELFDGDEDEEKEGKEGKEGKKRNRSSSSDRRRFEV